jgi:uncharacterized repeat protein (TIGR01451 family)
MTMLRLSASARWITASAFTLVLSAGLLLGAAVPAAAQPVLTVTKTFADNQVASGTIGHTFTIDVENTGDADATSVLVTDTVDPGLSVTGASGTGWDCTATSGNAVSCTLASLATGATAQVTVTYSVPAGTAPGTIDNDASASSTEGASDMGSDSVDVVTAGGGVTTADLSVTKTASSPATVGSPLTYTIKVQNAGPSGATGVTMIDTLPSSVTFISASSTSATCSQASGRVTCTIGSLAANASVTITVMVTPNAVGAITNTASVTGTTTDPTSNNNTATVTTTVGAPNHARSVTLKLRASLQAVGRVTVDDGFLACADSVGVKVQRKVPGHWTTLKLATTSSSGRYLANLPDRNGKYRVLAPRVPAADGICGKAVSPIRQNDDEGHIVRLAAPGDYQQYIV